ncbi:3'-5' exonuclease [Shewanella canadensis]|uniref:3'-5' exonuclease n=1 Tax=Shewanella canadensis TaxID=271096 RepID=A0A3S0RWL3_9GAMM|nr:exonuclease domain-containing protein [Shewanella canadensis]RTR37930.1 3'-5' exonuclease [Shewanella canadensis]
MGFVLRSQLCWRAFVSRSDVTKQYYRSQMPAVSQVFSEASLMAVDLEMTGLDTHSDQILSIGLIPIEKGLLQLNRAEQRLIQINGSVGHSATIHGIVDHQLQAGVSLDSAIEWFMERTRGKLLVAHHSPLDLGFLQVAIKQVTGESIKLLAIDTLAIERKRLLRKQDVLKEGTLRLGACRARYGLPVYAAHNALVDALACGELLLAQASAMGDTQKLTIGELLSVK